MKKKILSVKYLIKHTFIIDFRQANVNTVRYVKEKKTGDAGYI